MTGSAKTRHSRTKQISEISEKQKIWVSEQIVTNDIYIKMHSFTIRTDGFKVNVSKSQSMLLASRHRRDKLSSLQIFLDGNQTVVLNILVSLWTLTLLGPITYSRFGKSV